MIALQDNQKLYGVPCFLLALYAIAASAGVFVAGLWAYAGIGGGIVLFVAVGIRDRQLPWPEKHIALFTLLVLGVIALENLQSIAPHISWREWLKLFSIFVPLLVLTSSRLHARLMHPHFIFVLLVSAVSGALALSLELSLGGPLLHAVKGISAPLTQYNRGLSFLVILAFPLMAGLMQGRLPKALLRPLWVVLVFIVILLIPAGLTESRASKLALLVGLIVLGVAHFLPTLTRRGLLALSVICVGWPFAVQTFFASHSDLLDRIPPSWRARMEIWDYMSYRILERPWFGWGLGTSHLLPFKEPDGARYVITTIPAAHPHNVMTQLWVELGVPGVVLGLGFACLVLSKIGQLEKRAIPFALGAFAAALCLSLVAYDFWTDSLFSAFALAGLVFAMLQSPPAIKEI